MSKKKTQIEFDIQFEATGNKNVIRTTPYVNALTPIHCVCKVCGYEWDASPNALLASKGCRKCADKANGLRCRLTHEQFVENISKINPNITIIGTYTKTDEPVRVLCHICNHEWDAIPERLMQGKGCPICCNHLVVPGYNDVATTHPHLTIFFENPNDAKKYTFRSSKKVKMKCPSCGYEKYQSINGLYVNGFGCGMCSDGVSYPNKYIRSVIYQVKNQVDDYAFEYHSEWTKKYKYDIWFKKDNQEYIIEVDGEQHLGNKPKCKSKKFTRDEIANDNNKKELCELNNVILIRLACYQSYSTYIKNCVISSELTNILDLSNVDWEYCNMIATSNLVYKVCNDYNNGITDTSELSKSYQLSIPTIQSYLKRGTQLNICNYRKKTYVVKDGSRIKNCRMVRCKNTNQIFPSLKDAQKWCNLKSSGGIIDCCNGKKTTSGKHPITYEKLMWEYVNTDISAWLCHL